MQFDLETFFPFQSNLIDLCSSFHATTQLKLEIRTVLSTFIDEFTFKILSNIERNMTLSGLIQATYKFESPVFKTELYALREIPLPAPPYEFLYAFDDSFIHKRFQFKFTAIQKSRRRKKRQTSSFQRYR